MMFPRRLLAAGGMLFVLLLGAGMIFIGGAVLQDDQAMAQADPVQQRTVTASGYGEITVSPDTGVVTLGVEVSNESVDAALEQANQRIDAIVAALTELGIAQDDITTGNFSIWPERDAEDPKAAISGFHVSHTVTVKVREIGRTGEVISTAVNAGANNVQNVSFVLADQQAAIDQAREAALENAQHKGQELARLSNGSLGQVISISETSNGNMPQPIAGESAADSRASDVPLNPGAATVTVDLQVTWELQ